MQKRLLAVLLTAIMAIAIGTGCKPADQPADQTAPGTTPGTAGTTAQQHDDGVDTAMGTRVKTNLLADTEVGAMGIEVHTEGNILMLRGEVDTEAQRLRAEEIARETAGLNWTVQNQLVVRGGAAQPGQP
jgi:osmotically-inducible protein OsmY